MNSKVARFNDMGILKAMLSCRNIHITNTKLQLEKPESSVGRILEPPLDEIVAAHLRYTTYKLVCPKIMTV
uniref:Uncharacterized protein n=1 Tax=Timema cristinae TaxID=61476 RepID=A0A7R9CQT8_TIMCR|nr:unnamed protein product [Timema cristinae]